jgi:hypothetical protein
MLTSVNPMRMATVGLFLGLSIALLGVAPTAHAGPVAVESTAPLPEVGIAAPVFSDRDADGFPEFAAGPAAGGPCGGLYPVVVAGADVAALGQRASVVLSSAIVVCGTSADVDAHPARPDPNAPVDAEPILRFEPVVALPYHPPARTVLSL